MPKPNHEWNVLPHGPLRQIDDGVYEVIGEISMPLLDLPRRMSIVRLRDGRLVVWSAIAVDGATIARIEELGRPTFLVVPSEHHRLDAAAWKGRYPELVVIAPPGAEKKTSEVVAVDTTKPNFGDPDVRFETVPGTGQEEAALVVRRPRGTTLILNDIIGNIRGASGFSGWVLRRMGLAGDQAQVPTAVALLIVKDKQALSGQMLGWAEISDLRRVVVSHGEIIDDAPREVLREIASKLA